MRCKILLLVASLSVFTLIHTGIAQPVVSYSSHDEILTIGHQAVYFEDKNNALSLHDVVTESIAARFVTPAEPIPNFGNSSSTYWCRFTIQNTGGQELFLEFRKALSDEVEFYYQDSSGQYTSIRTGSAYSRNTRSVDDNFFIFQIPVSSKIETYYLRVKSVSNISFPLSLGSGRHMFSKHRDEEFLYGLYIGLILTLALYNLFILLATRDRNYLYYILYLLLNLILYDLSAIGFGAEYLWRDWIHGNFYYTLTDILVGLAVLINLLFISSFLDLKEKLPTVNRINKILYAVSILIIILNFFGFFSALPLTQVYIIGSSLYILFIVVFAYAHKIKRSRFLLIGWSLYILSIIFYELYVLGILPYQGALVNAIPVGTSLEALFFSFALADRIRELRQERLRVEQQNLALVKDQKQILERTVHERTMEIAAQNEEMAAQNEELITLQDQLHIQNERLEKKNQELSSAQTLIESQNKELIKYTDNLKEEVKLKANDLILSNEELVKHNHQLQQFSFITAHNLRAPVARILGLINLLNINKVNDEEKEFILGQIRISGQDLDQVIKDLTLILDIRKGVFEDYKPVLVKEKVNRVLGMLQAEIDKNTVNIHLAIADQESVRGLSAYVESILFNLISNAIKYRSHDRASSIEIRAQRENQFVNISVIDNGLGIDLEKQQHKIFGMYQRFHLHVEGRGLGLHLVKTQVESMGGKITIMSEPGKGTRFDVLLPTE